MPLDSPNRNNKNGNILLDAYELINGPRQDSYGNPCACFRVTADLWNEYKGSVEISAQDVCVMLALVKIARESFSHSPDNLVDACGYLALAADMVGE